MSWKLSCTVLRGGISGNAGSLLDQKLEVGKQAFHIHRQDRRLIAFAGLWEQWQHEAETLYSCTIITTVANALMQPIHERMPVIIPAELYHDWLNKAANSDDAYALLDNPGYADMATTPVSEWVNNPRHDDPTCIQPLLNSG